MNGRAHDNLKNRLAQFFYFPAALLYNSGLDTNVGYFSCVPSREILSYQTNTSTPLCTMAPVLLRLEDPIEHSIIIQLRPCGKSWSTFTSEGDRGTGGGAFSRGKRIHRRRRSTHHWDIRTPRQRHCHYAWVTKSGSCAVTYLWQGTR